jgi:hypothetical protein
MKPLSKVTLVTPSAVNLIDLGEIRSHHGYPGSHGTAIRLRSLQSHLYPMMSPRRIVSQKAWFSPGIENDHIDVTVIVEIVKRRSATAELEHHPVTRVMGDVLKSSLPIVPQEQVSGVVAGGIIEMVHVVDQVATG